MNGMTAFQGEEGAFSHQAVRQLLGPLAPVRPCERFEDVFRALVNGAVDAAVVPIENTLHGSVHENYDHLLNHDVVITGETQVRVSHCLIGLPAMGKEDVRRVYSHPVALNQCLDWFARHPELERMPFYDTAGAVKMLMETGRRDAAAIAGEAAAERYGAAILEREIEDDRQNYTRFFLLRRPGEGVPVAEDDGAEWKTSLVFVTGNTPGSLFRALAAFALRDLSLAKIESRPRRGSPWEYLFYLDLHGRADGERERRAIGQLGETAEFLRVLGSYRRGS